MFNFFPNRAVGVVILQRFVILKYFFFILIGAGLIAGIVVIIILALIIIGLLVYCIFWKRRQNKDGDTEFHIKNSKKRPISPKELGMGIHWEIFLKILCRNLTHFMSLVSFCTSWKHQKTKVFVKTVISWIQFY